MILNTQTHDKLFSGPVDYVATATIGASQDVQRGDLLEADPSKGAAAVFTRPAGAADPTMVHCIASKPIQTAADATALLPAYFAGYFNPDAMRFGGTTKAADNEAVLMLGHIFLRTAINAQPTV